MKPSPLGDALWQKFKDKDVIREFLRVRTKEEVAEAIGYSFKSVNRLEKNYGQKCCRVCPQCREKKLFELMAVNAIGYQLRNGLCNDCHREYLRTQYSTPREKIDAEQQKFKDIMEDMQIRMSGDDEWNGYKGQHGRLSYD